MGGRNKVRSTEGEDKLRRTGLMQSRVQGRTDDGNGRGRTVQAGPMTERARQEEEILESDRASVPWH